MLKEVLSTALSDSGLENLYLGFDSIGDIVVIKVPDALQAKKKLIGQAILERIKSTKVVLMQKGPVAGKFRIRKLEHIAGENRTTTLYREHGCSFLVDVADAYFSPRLSTERLRIANLIRPNERVLNMFGGVGSFSIVMAKVQPKCEVVSIDINPEAHKYAVENAKINKVSERVKAVLGDAREIIRHGGFGKFARVLMPLPESASMYLNDAIYALDSSGGYIHYYTHVHAQNRNKAPREAESGLKSILNAQARIELMKVVKEVGPRWFLVVADIRF